MAIYFYLYFLNCDFVSMWNCGQFREKKYLSITNILKLNPIFLIIYSTLRFVFTKSIVLSFNLRLLRENHFAILKDRYLGKSILQVPDTGTRILDNTKPFWCSSIVCFWMPPARSKERKYHIFGQYWYTRNVPEFTNTGTVKYLGPEVYFFLCLFVWFVLFFFFLFLFLFFPRETVCSANFCTLTENEVRLLR